MNTIVCVLKSGVFWPRGLKGYSIQYTPRNVQWLQEQCQRNLSGMERFVCLSDIRVPGVETRPLQGNLRGWWSKLEVFREFDHATYLDLDTVLVGDVSPYLFDKHVFTMASSLSRKTGFNSSLMCWSGDYSFLYHKILKNPEELMLEYSVHEKWGDQDFIRDSLMGIQPIEHFQHRYPNVMLSYKYDIRDQGIRPKVGRKVRATLHGEWWKSPRVVAFHGAPKPHEVHAPWIPPL